MPEVTKKKKIYKMPAKPGQWADRLFQIRAEKQKLTKKTAPALEALEAEEAQLKEHIIKHLPKDAASGVAGKLASVRVVSKDEPTLKDKAKLYAYIKKTGDFDLLGGLKGAAVKERWEQKGKKSVPGVDVFKVVTVSLSAL